MNLLKQDEYPAVFEKYIDTVVGDIRETLNQQLIDFEALILSIPESKGTFSYSEDKWSIKEVLCHVLDTERVMAYRALCFARNDMTSLPAFKEIVFVKNGRHNERTMQHIADEFTYLRKSNIMLYESLNEAELSRKGMAADRMISVRALFYVIAGHLNHHRIILKERYLK